MGLELEQHVAMGFSNIPNGSTIDGLLKYIGGPSISSGPERTSDVMDEPVFPLLGLLWDQPPSGEPLGGPPGRGWVGGWGEVGKKSTFLGPKHYSKDVF